MGHAYQYFTSTVYSMEGTALDSSDGLFDAVTLIDGCNNDSLSEGV